MSERGKDHRSKIAELLKQSEAANEPRSHHQSTSPSISVTGDSNVVGDGNVVVGGDVTVAPIVRPRVVVKTGDGVVDAGQKAELQRLIHDWVDARVHVRRSPFNHGAAWSAFNRHFGINSYAELPMGEFGAARAWLARQIGIVHSMPSAKKKVPGWRNRTMGAIKARCKNQLDDADFYRSYIQQHFDAVSLRDLTDDELQRVKQYVFGAKPGT